jgi:O-antigen/teichoic acid export membrane protein
LFNKYNSGIFLGKNRIKQYNRINWYPNVVVFLSIVIFVVLLGLNITGALMAAVLGPLFMFFFLLFKNDFIRSFSIKFNWDIIRAMLALGIVYALALLIINLNYKIDIILLDKLSSQANTGIYSKGVAIADFLWQIPMLLSTIVFARSSIAKDGLVFSKKVAQLLRLSFIFVGLGSLLLFFLANFIILLLYGIEFAKSTEVMRLLLPGVLLLTIFKVLNMDLAGKGKPWISMKAMIPAVIFNVVLNIVLIPQYGANGAAFSSTLSYTFAALLFLHFYSKEVAIPIRELLRYSKQDFAPILQLIKKFR